MVVSYIIALITAPLDFIYWIKWAIASIAVYFFKKLRRKRFGLHDINAHGDPVKLGYIVPTLEKELESPFPDSHLQDAADEIFFYGVNARSECLFVLISRGCNQLADAWIYLKLADGKTYCLAETAGCQQPFEENCLSFSCGKLQMHYLSPMRRWRIFYCGMMKEVSENEKDAEEVFVKFVLLWKASSNVYDCTLDSNCDGFTSAMAKATWRVPFVPPIKKLSDALNLYAQTGIIEGTVSVNEEREHEVYLFGERIRNLGKNADVGSQCTTVLGYIPEVGIQYHLTNVSAPYCFKKLPIGFIVDEEGEMEIIKKLDMDLQLFTKEKTRNYVKVNFNAGGNYELCGNVGEPMKFRSSQGWGGFLEMAFVEFKIGNRDGIGLILSGKVQQKYQRPDRLLSSAPFPEDVPLVVKFSDEVSHFGEVSGGKGASLGKLTQLREKEKTFVVPKGIVVTTSAYKEFLNEEILEAVKHLENIAYGKEAGDLKEACNKVSEIVKKTLLPQIVCQDIAKNLRDIYGEGFNKIKFAVRSSATGEDTEAMSAAGQMDTFLGIKSFREIFNAVKKCWASQFGHIAVEYKRRYGQVLNSPMAVVVQEMVACEVSGVLFTCDPVTNNPSVITITANYGLGETVVSGSVEPDTFTLRRKNNGQLEFDSVLVGTKSQRMIMQGSGGTVTEDIDESLRNESCLSKENAERLGNIAIQIEKFYKTTRDIEWGIVKDEVYILQSRPITSGAAVTEYEIKHEFDAPLRSENEYFTIANIGEVMPGATSPLGIEIIQKCFGNIFKKIVISKGVPDSFLKSKYYASGLMSHYNHMMGTVAEMIVRYGVDTLASKGFMISIFGRILDDPELLQFAYGKVKPKSKPSLCQQIKSQLNVKSKLKYYWDLFMYDYNYESAKKGLEAHPLNYLKKKTAKETFTAILKTVSDFDEAILIQYDSTESSSNWNMYLFRILCHAYGSINTDVYSDFANLLAISSNTETANIPTAMQEVARQVAKDVGAKKFSSMSIEEAEKWLQETSSLSGHKFRQFLKRHGHRCIKELDVQSVTWGMNPKLLVKILQNLAVCGKEEVKKEEDSIDKLFSKLHISLSLLSKCLLRFVLPNCRRAIRAREAGKSLTIKSYHNWRKGYRHLGKLMVLEGRLPDEDLIFYLTLDEIDELLKTRSPNIISRAYHRRKMHPTLENYKFMEIMKGLPKPVNEENESMEMHDFVADLVMKGIPVCQGVAKGYARVAMSLEEASNLKPGEILIAYSTDIGWSPYFPIISGVVTELGGLISHGAVVSREYGLPCVVGLQGATKQFRTGDYVLLDGKKGTLQRLPQPDT